jgi:hypothetical protein
MRCDVAVSAWLHGLFLRERGAESQLCSTLACPHPHLWGGGREAGWIVVNLHLDSFSTFHTKSSGRRGRKGKVRS